MCPNSRDVDWAKRVCILLAKAWAGKESQSQYSPISNQQPRNNVYGLTAVHALLNQPAAHAEINLASC